MLLRHRLQGSGKKNTQAVENAGCSLPGRRPPPRHRRAPLRVEQPLMETHATADRASRLAWGSLRGRKKSPTWQSTVLLYRHLLISQHHLPPPLHSTPSDQQPTGRRSTMSPPASAATASESSTTTVFEEDTREEVSVVGFILLDHRANGCSAVWRHPSGEM